VRAAPFSAEAFYRQFPTGGGRKTAAGINHLPADALEAFVAAFETQFARPAATE